MLLAVEVVHRLDGIERREGHFHEYRGPVAHRAVPQAGQFEGFEFTAVLALVGDEAREPVYVLRLKCVPCSNIAFFSASAMSICELSRICGDTVPSLL